MIITKAELENILKEHDLDSERLKKAFAISQTAHKDQVRDGGESYLEGHIYPLVAQIIYRYKNSADLEILILSAFLHDVVEDSDIKIDKIRSEVGREVAEIVKVLTKPKTLNENLTQEEKFNRNILYLEKVSKSSPSTIIVKIEDRIQNLKSISQANIKTKPDKYKRYLKEVRELFITLAEKTDNAQEYIKILKAEMSRVENLLKSN